MPGDDSDYYVNFQRGNPFAKIKEGYYRLPGEGYAKRHEELKGLDPEDYPDIFKYKILADVAPHSDEFNSLRGKLQNQRLAGKDLAIFNEVERQMQEKNESTENFRDPKTYESFLGRYSATLVDVLRANPMEYMLPFSPARKFLPGPDPLTRYEEKIIGKDFKSWEDPIEDFIMPGLRVAASHFGFDGVPGDVQENRETSDYFDKIQTLKHYRAAEEARSRGDDKGASYFLSQADKTMSGLDPYADQNAILSAIPKEERAFFAKFVNAPGDQRRRILELASPQMREIYMAQWDKQLLEAADQGKLDMNRNQVDELRNQIETRATQVRARRKSQLSDFANSSSMPGNDWAGWRQDVDVRDIQLKHLINRGKDVHEYGFWNDRMRKLARKPYLDQAARELNFESGTKSNLYEQGYNQAAAMGLHNASVSILPSIHNQTQVNIDRMRIREREEMLRDGGIIP